MRSHPCSLSTNTKKPQVVANLIKGQLFASQDGLKPSSPIPGMHPQPFAS